MAAGSCLDENVAADYAAGALPPEGARLVEEHVDQCEDCRRWVAHLVRSTDGATARAEATPLDARDEPPHVGQLLAGRFRLRRPLGHGGMGLVFEAEDQLLHTPVAIKLLRPEIASLPGLLRQLHREILVGRRIGHPNVCRLYDLGTSGDVHFITMELLDGETLEERLARGPLPPAEVAAVLEQVCAALAAAHHEDVVHRDLKPSNIMVDRDGRVKVMDFGLARDLGDETSLHAGPVGTPAYWAPEQARGEPATRASDIYALGLIAYRMLTGKHLPVRGGARELAAAPAPYRPVLARCLQLEPAARFPSAAAVRAAVQRARTRPRPGAGVRWGVALGAAALLALGGYLALGRPALRSRPEGEPPAPALAWPASLRAELDRLEARRRARGLLAGDVASYDESLGLVRQRVAEGRLDDARAELARAEGALAAARLDLELCRRKHARLQRQWRARFVEVQAAARVRQLLGAADAAGRAGDAERANALLNQAASGLKLVP